MLAKATTDRRPTGRVMHIRWLVLALIPILLLACDTDISNIGKPTYTDVTPPSPDESTQAEMDEWERVTEAVYERGFRDGRNENCGMYKKFLDGQVSQAYAERGLNRMFNERSGAYASRLLANQYREGWREGAASLNVAFMGEDPC